jgi:hypothetical protein
MTDLLTPDEAAPLAGVPAVQLRRWAYLSRGPLNIGTRMKPMYRDEDIAEWREALSGRSHSDPR